MNPRMTYLDYNATTPVDPEVVEAMSDDGEFFGNARLLETFRTNRHLAVPSLLRAIVTTVQQFSGREQEDDLTLVVARAR